MTRKLITINVLLLLLAASATAQDWIYSARPGETLAAICEDYVKENNCWRKLVQHNEQITDDGKIEAGTRVKIPVEWLINPPVAVTAEYVLGDVFVQRKRTEKLNKLQAGMLLQMGDGVVTANGNVLLRFADGSALQLKPQSEVIFDQLSTYSDSGMIDTSVRLNRGGGHFSIKSKDQKNRYRISTPSAIAAVRGTIFRVSSDPDEGDIMRNEVLEGTVEVAGSAASQTVNEGYGTLAELNKKPIPPKELLPPPELDLPSVLNVPARLSWTPVTGAVSYIVDIFEGENTERLLFEMETDEPDYVLNALENGLYTLAIRGVDELGLQGINVETQFTAKQDFHAPQLTATSIVRNGDSLAINWPDVDGAVAYQVEVSRTKDFSTTLFSQRLTGNSVSLDQPKGKYYVRTQSLYADDVRSDYGESFAWADKIERNNNIWKILLPALAWAAIIFI